VSDTEQNWDTLETERWLDNDEGLYFASRGANEETIRELVGMFIPRGMAVTLREINWDYLTESVSR